MIIPYGKQDITKKDIEAVVKVLRSSFLTQGPSVPAFEQKLCEYTSAKYAVAVNSCTSALHIACIALGLKHGDILWTSPITFVASANCALYCGATVDFVDIDPGTALMSVESLSDKLKKAEKKGRLPKIVIPVHFAGQPCDMKGIYDLSLQYGFKIIEDAAHAIGAKYQNEIIGNCKYSDITVFSFHPVKIITTGEGGASLTNSSSLSQKMSLLRSHGITRDPSKMKSNLNISWYYEQIDLGFNYRMTDIQAALGISQMDRLDQYVSNRVKIANFYNDKFKNTIIKPLSNKSDRNSSHHLYVIKMSNNKIRNALFDKLLESKIGVNLHYIPVYKHPYFKINKLLDNSEKYYNCAISIPIFPSLEFNNIEYIANIILDFVKKKS
jgi:UDP-4-amino-4,6-dideoxy-N-acetyl-beta-L-altrosamine transaminase